MYVAYTAEQEALRQELRSYFGDLMTPEVQAESAVGDTGGPACLEAVRKMGRDGWLGLGWPTEYGGQGRTDIDQFIFINEAWRAGAPIPFLTINTVGRTIMEFGSEEQKRFFLPKILAGELHFSIGYTEPNAGTDLASLTTRAVKDGDEWVINGQKIYTSLASYADYIWLAARTDPDAPKHAGITIFAVPTSDPGFSYSKISTMVNASTYNTFYDNVRVGDDAVIADVNKGWHLITNQLNYERVSLGPPGMVERVYDDVRRWTQDTKLPDGRRVADQEWVQLNLARVHAKLEFVKLINWKVAAAGGANPADASATKVFATEFYTEAYRHLMEILGPNAYLRGSAAHALSGRLERAFQGALILTFGGGVNEVQRDLIALFGLGLPRIRATDMDFTLTDDQQAIADLAHRILSERLPPEQLLELEQTDRWFADDVWAELGKADLLGIALPEADGGGGYGILEACLIAEQIGRTVAPVPYLSSIVASAMPIAEFGSDEQRKRLLPDVIAGATTLAVALYEPTDVAVPVVPTTQATPDGDGWRLDGEKSLVVGGDRAAAILVPARTSESTSAVFLVSPEADGVHLTRESAVSGEPQWTVRLDRVGVDGESLLGGAQQGADIVSWITDRLAAAVCATQTGVCEEALAITARYVSEREQFGSKLGTFQAVGQRVADAYIDTEAIRLTTQQAVWRLAEGLEAQDELMTAKFWAAEGAQRVVHAAQHLHGGIGMDLDYPIHRYFRWAKVLELTLGGASPSLLRLGASLATQPVGGS